MAFFSKIKESLTRSREKIKEQMNVILDRGPELDDDFWEGLEEVLILADLGGRAAMDIVEDLQDKAKRLALPDAYAVLDYLNETIAEQFVEDEKDILGSDPACILFVGVNGSGKTTTVGKLAKENHDAGRTVVLGSADTFRAAAIEQLEVWSKRADVEMCARERGSDPASVCYDTIERGEAMDADLILIDTAGRLHTSNDLMRELQKVVNVVRKRSKLPVYNVIVIDATTGQNGLSQAREFNKALDLDGVIVTKLDGSAKGGIALAISKELELPILKLGTGEGLDDLKDFDAHEYAAGLVGDYGRSASEGNEDADFEAEDINEDDEFEIEEIEEDEIDYEDEITEEAEPCVEESLEEVVEPSEDETEPGAEEATDPEEDYYDDFDDDADEDDFYEMDMEEDFEDDEEPVEEVSDEPADELAEVIEEVAETADDEVEPSEEEADDLESDDVESEDSAEDEEEEEEEERESWGKRFKRFFVG